MSARLSPRTAAAVTAAAVTAGVLVAGLGILTGGPAVGAVAAPSAGSTGPAEIPGDAALAASVTWFTVDGSVTVFDVPGSVTALREETTRGSQVTVSVNADVLFDFGKATLTREAVTQIDAEAARMPRGARVTVDGYTDSVGTDAANLVLSRQRAQAVADRLRAARPDLLPSAAGHGEADPVAPNAVGGKDNPLGRAKNRRVTLTFGR